MKTYQIARMPSFEVAGTTHGGEVVRDNDGSLIIMERDPKADENRRAVVIPRVADVKRSERHSAEDPEQTAFANRVVALLNSTPPRVMIAPSGGGLYEVRVIGVGGWRTTHNGDLSSCRSDARATAQVLGVAVEDDNG